MMMAIAVYVGAVLVVCFVAVLFEEAVRWVRGWRGPGRKSQASRSKDG